MYYFALISLFSAVSADIPTEPILAVTGNETFVIESESSLINGTIEVDTNPRFILFKNGDSYYYIETAAKGNYFQATQFCNYHNMRLLSIETPEKNRFLFEKLRDLVGYASYSAWTSGTNLAKGPQWVWLSTGGLMKYYNWMAGQPDNAGGNEHCIELIYEPQKHSDVVWNDNNCDSDRFTICETRKRVSSISKHDFQRNVTSVVDVDVV